MQAWHSQISGSSCGYRHWPITLLCCQSETGRRHLQPSHELRLGDGALGSGLFTPSPPGCACAIGFAGSNLAKTSVGSCNKCVRPSTNNCASVQVHCCISLSCSSYGCLSRCAWVRLHALLKNGTNSVGHEAIMVAGARMKYSLRPLATFRSHMHLSYFTHDTRESAHT